MSSNKLRAAIIGLGNMSKKDHIPAIIESNEVDFVGACDTNHDALQKVSQQYGCEVFTSVRELIASVQPNLALVAVPHDQYLPIISELAKGKVNILKEKPFARTLEEAQSVYDVIEKSKVKFGIVLQRRFDPVFQFFKSVREKIGRIFYFDLIYGLNIQNLDEGWRSSKEKSGGGCLIDMGYHSIDLINWYFGVPKSVQCNTSGYNREGQEYDVEDTCTITFDYGVEESGKNKFFGRALLTRVSPLKMETMSILGTQGFFSLNKNEARMELQNGEIHIKTRAENSNFPFLEQINQFASWIKGKGEFYSVHCEDHFDHMQIIESAYRSASNGGLPIEIKELVK